MRSDEITKGVARAPHRSLLYAMGYLPEDLEKPIIGVVNAHNEVSQVISIWMRSHRRSKWYHGQWQVPLWNFRLSASAMVLP